MESLIQGVLQYSRAGKSEPTTKWCDFKEVTDEVINSIAVPKEFLMKVDSSIQAIYADPTQIIQVFSNLLSNAIKHNHNSHGHIQITAKKCEEGWVEILVADDGPGIPMEYSAKIFQMFQTLEPRDKTENTGVGLTIVKKIIEKRGGTIELFNSGAPGTTFKILWPNEAF